MRILLLLGVGALAGIAHAEAGVPGLRCTADACPCGVNTCRCGETCFSGFCSTLGSTRCSADVECGSLCGPFFCNGGRCDEAAGGGAGGGASTGGGASGGGGGGSAGAPGGGWIHSDSGLRYGGMVQGPLPQGCGCSVSLPAAMIVLLPLLIRSRSGKRR